MTHSDSYILTHSRWIISITRYPTGSTAVDITFFEDTDKEHSIHIPLSQLQIDTLRVLFGGRRTDD